MEVRTVLLAVGTIRSLWQDGRCRSSLCSSWSSLERARATADEGNERVNRLPRSELRQIDRGQYCITDAANGPRVLAGKEIQQLTRQKPD